MPPIHGQRWPEEEEGGYAPQPWPAMAGGKGKRRCTPAMVSDGRRRRTTGVALFMLPSTSATESTPEPIFLTCEWFEREFYMQTQRVKLAFNEIPESELWFVYLEEEEFHDMPIVRKFKKLMENDVIEACHRGQIEELRDRGREHEEFERSCRR